MTAELTPDTQQLIETKSLAHFVTLMPDGSPQVTPVWVDHDGTHVLINTAEGRQKPKNLNLDKRVALSIADHENPYRYVQIRGRVVEVTREGARDHIEKMARKYMGEQAQYPHREGEVRILIKILPEHIEGRAARPRE
ncbi:MAG TPA: PPOX class F420-dependent oxidoreductase [Dehalococcoidia bacterium]|nr:PPOX class F420-dependent oxidoreductase [Dehalococcoidia bacterium]